MLFLKYTFTYVKKKKKATKNYKNKIIKTLKLQKIIINIIYK